MTWNCARLKPKHVPRRGLNSRLPVGLALAATLAMACGQPPVTVDPADKPPANASIPSRTLVMAMRNEPASLAAKPLQNPGGAFYTIRRLFNAELAIFDDRGLPRPYLSEALPRLHTDAWRVFPDGRMETTYRLRANLRWHDGTPFSANDFAFAWHVYSHPQLGTASVPPVTLMEQVLAPDERTVAIRWRLPYAEADALVDNLFPPLPQQILEASLRDDLPEVFAAHPYWSREFVGLGPYRLDRWEPGAFLEATGFDSFVLGRAKISRIKVLFINDSNTALAAMLAGEVQLAADDVLGFQQSVALKREWEPQKAGTVIQHPNQWRSIRFQFRPDVVSPRALLDVRVRRALAYGIDKQSINETIYEGEGFMADTAIPPTVDYYPSLERIITKYSYDMRRTERLMAEAGFVRGADGSYASPGEGKLGPLEIKTTGSRAWELEQSALAAGWRQAGFEIQEAIHPAALAQVAAERALFPAMYTQNRGLGEIALLTQTTESIPRPENRWVGNNRGGWSNAEFDRVADAFNGALERPERVRLMAELARIYNDDLGGISLFFATQALAHVAALTGPRSAAPQTAMGWNVHEWELK